MADSGKSTEQEDLVGPQAKKARKLPPLEDFKNYGKVVFVLRRLQRAWNLLDCDPYDQEYYEHGPERGQYLHDMAEIIKDGSCSYQNPFGSDDRESFANNFEELTDQEQVNFRELALLCKKEARPIGDDDLNQFLSKQPEEPFFVSLAPLPDGTFANGSERHPFLSMKDAVEFKRLNSNSSSNVDVDVIAINCSCKEKTIVCKRKGCQIRLCPNHGDGHGTWDRELGEVIWDWTKCMDCKEVVTCRRHPLRQCDVCANGSSAQASLTGCGPARPFSLCSNCATVCNKKVQDDNSLHYGETCGFRCCRGCLKSHRCGDDPTEYC